MNLQKQEKDYINIGILYEMELMAHLNKQSSIEIQRYINKLNKAKDNINKTISNIDK